MISKNRTSQLILQSAYCALAVIGALASLGIFRIDEGLRWDFFVHFTNLSNYFCMVVMFAELIFSAKKANAGENGYCSAWRKLKFIGLVMITVTFLVFNFVLAPKRPYYYNFRINSVLMHIVLPILYAVDWILFYEHGKVRARDPIVTLSMPIAYVVFIFVRSAIMKANGEVATDTNYMYPYFFLNVDQLGIGGLVKWIAILLAVFCAVGYLYFLLDRVIGKHADRHATT